MWFGLGGLIGIFFVSNLVKGDVQILEPREGLSFDASKGSAEVYLKWVVTDEILSKDEIQEYVFTLVSGPNFNIQLMLDLGTLTTQEAEDMEMKFKIPSNVGTNGDYYIQVFAGIDNGYTIHYSNRFSLTGMDGNREAENSNIKQPPEPEIRINFHDLPIEIDSASFSIPYNLQSGKVKYAPMQLQPLTKVTRVSWRKQHDTSAVTYYTTIRNSIDRITTITPGLSYELNLGANYATPGPMPKENGNWYDPHEKLSLKPRKRNR